MRYASKTNGTNNNVASSESHTANKVVNNSNAAIINDLMVSDTFMCVTDILVNNQELAAYAVSIVKSIDGDTVNEFVFHTGYATDDEDFTAMTQVIADALNEVDIRPNYRATTRLKRLIESCGVAINKTGDVYEKASTVLGEVSGEIFSELGCSQDDSVRLATILLLSSVVTDVTQDGRGIDDAVEQDSTASSTKAPKMDESISGAIDSLTQLVLGKYLTVWLVAYGEKNRDKLAGVVQRAVSKVVTGSTDAAQAIQKPDEFIDSYEMKILETVKELMENPEKGTPDIDTDSVRNLLVATIKDGLSSKRTSLLSGILSFVPDKFLTIFVDALNKDAVTEVKETLLKKGYQQKDVDAAIRDKTHPIRIAATKFMLGGDGKTSILGVFDALRDEAKGQIVDFVKGAMSTIIDTHISLSDKEIEEFADSFIDSVMSIDVAKDVHKTTPVEERVESHIVRDESPKEINLVEADMGDIMKSIFDTARKNLKR